METVAPGVFVAGACQGPKDIPDSVAQAGSAAAAVLNLLASGAVDLDPTVAVVEESTCGGCGLCVVDCPESAVELNDRGGRMVAVVNDVLCRSCGSCAATCPTGAATQLGYTDAQLLAEVVGLSAGVPQASAYTDR